MRDDARHTLKWLEQELMAAERADAPVGISDDTADLLSQVDSLLEDLQSPEPPGFARKKRRPTKGEKVERSRVPNKVDPSAAVFTKTKRQLRKERRKQKKETVNRNIKDLVVLAILEIIGILCILGWWFQ